MRLFNLKNMVLGSALGLVTLVGINSADAQVNREYRDYQRAQREVQEKYRDYLRTRSARDYREWQQAQREAQREYRDFRQEYREDVRDNRRDTRRYRIVRNGSYYQTDYRGAELLRQAVNSGYQQGYRQGQLDRSYGRRMSYYDDNVYRVATFGYQSYVDRGQYQHYFQQGFQRGYQDGYYSRTQYGYRSNNGFNILGSVLNTILNIATDN